jgi:hypothetical protein
MLDLLPWILYFKNYIYTRLYMYMDVSVYI